MFNIHFASAKEIKRVREINIVLLTLDNRYGLYRWSVDIDNESKISYLERNSSHDMEGNTTTKNMVTKKRHLGSNMSRNYKCFDLILREFVIIMERQT